jgi:hypothetical protein
MAMFTLLGVTETMCPEQQKRWEASGETYAAPCRYDCSACLGSGKVPARLPPRDCSACGNTGVVHDPGGGQWACGCRVIR